MTGKLLDDLQPRTVVTPPFKVELEMQARMILVAEALTGANFRHRKT